MMTTLLTILIGLQLVQSAALVVLFRILILQRREQAKNAEVVVNIRESRYTEETVAGRFPWYLYEPGSRNHPGSTKELDKYRTARGAISAARRKFPGRRVVVTDGYFENVDPQAVLDGKLIEAGTPK